MRTVHSPTIMDGGVHDVNDVNLLDRDLLDRDPPVDRITNACEILNVIGSLI